MGSLDRWQVRVGLVTFWCVTVLTPLIIAPIVLSYDSGIGWRMEPMYYFLFGAYNPPGGAEPSGWLIGPGYVVVIFILLFFFIAYALLVTNYCIKPTSQLGAVVAGVISLAIPMFLFGRTLPMEAWLNGIYAGPMPFQFITGLFLMWIVKRGIEIPCDGLLEGKPSWWKKTNGNSVEEKTEEEQEREGNTNLPS